MSRKIISEYSIFRPDSKRRIQQDYPEISLRPVFQKLSPDEMIFVWYYACEASPYFDIDSDRERTEKSLKAAFSRPGEGIQYLRLLFKIFFRGNSL